MWLIQEPVLVVWFAQTFGIWNKYLHLKSCKFKIVQSFYLVPHNLPSYTSHSDNNPCMRMSELVHLLRLMLCCLNSVLYKSIKRKISPFIIYAFMQLCDNIIRWVRGEFSFSACLVWDKFYFCQKQIYFSVLLILRPFRKLERWKQNERKNKRERERERETYTFLHTSRIVTDSICWYNFFHITNLNKW